MTHGMVVVIIPFGTPRRFPYFFLPHCFGYLYEGDGTMTYIEATLWKRWRLESSVSLANEQCTAIKKRDKPSFYWCGLVDYQSKDAFPNIFPCTAILRRRLGYPWFCTFWHPFVRRVRKYGMPMVIHNSQLIFPGDIPK